MDDEAEPPMPPYEVRVLWLIKPEMQKYMLDFAKSRFKPANDAAAKDVFQDANALLILMLLRGKGAREEKGMRGWVTRTLKNLTYVWWRIHGEIVRQPALGEVELVDALLPLLVRVGKTLVIDPVDSTKLYQLACYRSGATRATRR